MKNATLIQNYQRLTSRYNRVRSRYEEQIKKLGLKQIELENEIVKEMGIKNDWGYDAICRFDELRINDDGDVECWTYGRCGDSDECTRTFSIDPLIIDGKYDEFKQKCRDKHAAEQKKREDKKLKEKQQRREQLEQELAKLNKEVK